MAGVTAEGGRTEDDRPDLAAMAVRLGRALSAGEQPILDTHGLTMWAYAVLATLAARPTEPIRTQAALADAIRADRTRIIAVLDDLQQRGLMTRTADPADRRNHLLSLTPAGRQLCDAAQSAIRTYERRLLDRLPADDRRGFLRALNLLADTPWEELVDPR